MEIVCASKHVLLAFHAMRINFVSELVFSMSFRGFPKPAEPFAVVKDSRKAIEAGWAVRWSCGNVDQSESGQKGVETKEKRGFLLYGAKE